MWIRVGDDLFAKDDVQSICTPEEGDNVVVVYLKPSAVVMPSNPKVEPIDHYEIPFASHDEAMQAVRGAVLVDLKPKPVA